MSPTRKNSMPVDANATTFPTWSVTVNNTQPLWFYCRQHAPTGASHCGAGMVFAVNPGDGVATDMATRTFEAEPGMKGMTPIKVEDSVNGMLNIIDGATRESLGGEFVNFDGTKFTW